MITNDQKVEMFKMRIEGVSIQEIGEHFGITKQRVSQIMYVPHSGRVSFDIIEACIYPNLISWMAKNRFTVQQLHYELFGYVSGVVKTYKRLKGQTEFKIAEIRKILNLTGMTFNECFELKQECQEGKQKNEK
ncbi:helix-turn-helix domain-containing protein [Ihubacter sp. rT4E-8]|uniref:helix-turn-helix domain-containing protein n=1 Tax=Ihubacter sp. rT4E-8 TaxID=3242369 RepID=UPI003CF8313C